MEAGHLVSYRRCRWTGTLVRDTVLLVPHAIKPGVDSAYRDVELT